jgi:hypothetical protein
VTDYDARACRRFYRVTLLALSGRTNRSISKWLERAGPLKGKNSKNVVARDERGRWLKGFSGGPGRPLGSRNKLSEDFLRDLQEDWEQHGKKIIKIMREKFPEIYFQSMVKLALVHRVELGRPKEFDKPRTVEEALLSRTHDFNSRSAAPATPALIWGSSGTNR